MNSVSIKILNTDGKFDALKSVIETVTKQEVIAMQQEVSVSNVEIIFEHAPEQVVEEFGFGGYTPDGNTIYISVDTDRLDILEKISKKLSYTILHELHHALRWRTVGYGDTLGEALVTEGLADHSAIEILKEEGAPWVHALNEQDLVLLLDRARKEFLNKEYSHPDWFFGGNGLPKWGGYALGFYIVQKYLTTHPELRASRLCDVRAEEILSSLA